MHGAAGMSAGDMDDLRTAFDPDQPRDKDGKWTRGWHLTDNPNFVPDPTHIPERNRTRIMDALTEAPAGLFVGDPEYWKNGHGYERPYVAEIEGTITNPPSAVMYTQKEQFMQGDMRVVRIVTLDEYAREEFGEMGWVESYFDPRSYGPHVKMPKGYKARNVSDMTKEELADWERKFEEYANRKDGPRARALRDAAFDPNQPRDEDGKWTQVGITSAGPQDGAQGGDWGKIKKSAREFRDALKALPGVKNVSVELGSGVFFGVSEPTWVVAYNGNGAARRLLAETGQRFNQDAVLLITEGNTDAAVELTFAQKFSNDRKAALAKTMASFGIDGGTWYIDKAGQSVLRMASVKAWRGDRTKHLAATEAFAQWLDARGVKSRKFVRDIATEVMNRASYARELGQAEKRAAQDGSTDHADTRRTHEGIRPNHGRGSLGRADAGVQRDGGVRAAADAALGRAGDDGAEGNDLRAAYDPDQPRDDAGRWTDTGVSGSDAGRGSGSGVSDARATAPRSWPQPNVDAQRVANIFNATRGYPSIDHSTAHVVNEATARAIADAYDALPVDDSANPDVKEAYEALAAEVDAQYAFAVAQGMQFIPWAQDGQPYQTSVEMAEDVRTNKRLYFFTGGEPHPFLSKVDEATGLTRNDKFRAIHDYFGHAAAGVGFGARGEENAWAAHSQMFSPAARRAMTTETRGQNSWVNFGRQNYNADGTHKNIPAKDRPYAAQKVALLPLVYSRFRGAAFNPDQPRDKDGQWTDGGTEGGTDAFMAELEGVGYRNPINPRERVIADEAAIEVSVYDGNIHLSSIRSFTPKSGAGTRTMRRLIDMADRHGVTIEGDAVPFGRDAISKTKLLKWYRDLGFKVRYGEGVVYTPRKIRDAEIRTAKVTKKPRNPFAFIPRFDVRNPRVIDAAAQSAARLVTRINQTTRSAINNIVTTGIAGGLTVEEMADDILEFVGGDERRADLIARNETMMAVHEGEHLAWDDAIEEGLLPDYTRRVWIVTPDDRLCPICEELDGTTADMGGQYPGGYDGPPAHVSCRCAEGLTFDEPRTAEALTADIEALLRTAFDPNQPRDEDGKWTDGGGGGRGAVTSTPQFKKWFGESKVVDDDGDPLVVYHGTTHNFEAFEEAGAERYNLESDWGAAAYFSSSPDDINENYAKIGPDLESRIQQRADQIDSEKDRPWAEHAQSVAEATEELSGGTALSVPVYLSLQNPFIVGGDDETELTLEYEYEDDDPEKDIIGERGTLVDFAEELRSVASRYDDADVHEFISELTGNGEGMSATELSRRWKTSENGAPYATDDLGRQVRNEIFRQALERAGFDGVIDRTAGVRFSHTMKGMGYDTTHYIVFDPRRIKSAIGNRTFNPSSRLIAAFDKDQPRDESGRWTDGGGSGRTFTGSQGYEWKLAEEEQSIRGLPNEVAIIFDRHGKRLTFTSNDPSKVVLSNDLDLRDAVLTHNHPTNTGLSIGDGAESARRNLSEMRAVVLDGAHVIRREGARWPKNFRTELLSIHNDVMYELALEIRDKKLDVKTANARHHIEVYTRLQARIGGFTYTFEGNA